MKIRSKIMAGVLAVGLMASVSACDSQAKNAANKARKHDQRVAGQQLLSYQDNQPTPLFTWSQLRQNLIEIETSQVQTTQTTSFMFNMGVPDPVMSCPSIGFPIPSNYQITNPSQKVPSSDVVLPQVEANGVFTADSTGTYVMCVGADGKAFAFYWEGFVASVSGPAEWNTATHNVKMLGPSSFDYSEGK